MGILKEDLARLTDIYKALKTQREPLVRIWRMIAENIEPAYGQMDAESPPQPMMMPDEDELIDGTVRYYSHLSATGLEGYACSSKSDFFAIKPADPEQQEDTTIIQGLQARQRAIYKAFQDSNFYSSNLPFFRSFLDLGTAIYIMGATEKGEMYYEFVPCYQCQAMKDPRTGRANVLFRDLWFTKYDAKKNFGEDKLPKKILEEKDELKYFHFIQLLAPRDRFELDLSGNEYEWIELVWAADYPDAVCFEGGDHHQRFVVTPFADNMDGLSDFAWGIGSPGMRQYVTAKALHVNLNDQWYSSRYQASPALKVTDNMAPDIEPGGLVSVPPGGDISVLQLGSDLSWTNITAQRLIALAKSDYFVDFFLMLSQYQGNVNTATLAQGLQNEQVNMMVSFLDCLSKRFFEPVIEYTYYKLQEMNRFPDDEFNTEFKDLKIDFVSLLYILQRQAVELTPTRNVMAEALQLQQFEPAITAYINVPQYIKTIRELMNADARIIRSDEEAQKIIAEMNRRAANAQNAQYELEKQKADAQTISAASRSDGTQNSGNQNRTLRVR